MWLLINNRSEIQAAHNKNAWEGRVPAGFSVVEMPGDSGTFPWPPVPNETTGYPNKCILVEGQIQTNPKAPRLLPRDIRKKFYVEAFSRDGTPEDAFVVILDALVETLPASHPVRVTIDQIKRDHPDPE